MLRWSGLHVDMLTVMLLAHNTQACCCLHVMLYYVASSLLACRVVLRVQAAAGRLGVRVVSTVPMAPRCCRCPRPPRGRVGVVLYTCKAFVFVSVERAVVAPVLSTV